MRVAVAVLMTAVVLAACGGSKDNRASTTKKVTTTTGAEGATANSAAGPASGSQSTAAGGLRNSGQPGTTAKPSGTPSANNNSASPPASPSGLKPTAPGTYKFTVTGTRRGGTPPTTQTINDQADATVDPPTGADQHSKQVDNNNPQANQDQTLRYLADGIYLVDLKLGGVIEFKPSQPVLEYPEPATIGKAWSWEITSTDGATTVHTDLKVLRNENQMVGSESVATTVLDVTITTRGQFTSTTHETVWVSEKYRIIVRTDGVSDVTQPVFVAGHAETSTKLVSTKPS